MTRALGSWPRAVVPVVLFLLWIPGSGRPGWAQAAQSRASRPEVRILGPVDNANRITLRGTVNPLANARNDRGPAPAGMQLERMQIVLRRSAGQEADLRRTIADQHRKGSADYHKWLTPEEFGRRFGPSDEDIAAVSRWLQERGFQVVRVEPGRQVMEIAGTALELETAFHLSLHAYQVNGRRYYANATDPQIPAALAPVLGGFVSLNNFPAVRMSRYLGKAELNVATHRATPEWTMPGTGALGAAYVVGPADFATQYNLNPLYQGAPPLEGQGQSIVVVNDSNINLNHVNDFRTLFGLPANPPQVIVDGNDPGINGENDPNGPNGDAGEAYIDVEWAGAVAPAATVKLVIAADSAVESGLMYAVQRAIYSNLAPVMSVSFGYCESGLGTTNTFLQQLWEQAAAQGITVLVASGDTGSAGQGSVLSGCDDPSQEAQVTNGLGVSGFASTPFNVAVGGTDFYYAGGVTDLASYWNSGNGAGLGSLKSYVPEQAWNDSQYGLNLLRPGGPSFIGGGGGASSCGEQVYDQNGNDQYCLGYPKPAWQAGVAGIPNDRVRDLPDVSLFAANGLNGSYYAVCAADGDCQPGGGSVQISGYGGTSVASPAMAGILALINQKYGPQGQADYVLYPLAVQVPAAFHDVTAGTNAMPCAMNSRDCTNGMLNGYAAAPGYDLATGLGTVNAAVMVANWNKVQFAATTTTLTPSATSFSHGTKIMLNAGVTGAGGTPSGDVAIMADSPLTGNQGITTLTLANGSASTSAAYLPGGTYNIWGRYGGDARFAASASAKTQITVSPENSSLYLNAVTPYQQGYYPLAGQQVPYGTRVILDAQPVPASFARNKCQQAGGPDCSPFTTATGTVTFTDGGSALVSPPLDSEGHAEVTLATLPVGTHTIQAAYSGDASYNTSTSGAVSFQVAQATPLGILVTGLPNPAMQGQALTLTAVVETGANGAAPTGKVTFLNGTTTLGTGALSGGVDPAYGVSGVAVLTIPRVAFPVGMANLTVQYGGDVNYAAATGNLGLTVNAASGLLASSVSAVASPGDTASPDSRITVSVTVTGQAGQPAPTGFVNLQISGLNGGGFPVAPGAAGASTASFTVDSSTLLEGVNAYVVQYAGDARYAPSQTTLTLNNPPGDFAMVAQSPVVTVQTGGTATSVLNLSSIQGFNGPVALTCAAPPALSCSLDPGSVTVNGFATATLTVKADETAAGAGTSRFGWLPAGGGAVLACALFLGLPGRRRLRNLLGMIAVVVLLAAAGCGISGNSGGNGGGNSGPPAPTGPTGTPIGTYTVIVTGGQGTAVTHNVAITVQVVSGTN